jgi:hypothetical protein
VSFRAPRGREASARYFAVPPRKRSASSNRGARSASWGANHDHTELTAATPTLFTVNAKAALDVTPAAQLTNSRSIDEAETIIHDNRDF